MNLRLLFMILAGCDIMVPNKFSMVDLEGIDIVESQGIEIPGLYQKLANAIAQCRYQVIYNWKFDSILIPPSYVEMEVDGSEIKINENISVSNSDIVYIHSLEIHIRPVIRELSVTENGEYRVPEGVDGFNPVIVDVQSVFESIEINANGVYYPSEGVDGFDSVEVNISEAFFKYPPIRSVTADSVFAQVVSGLGQPRPECAFGEDTKNWWGSASNGQHWIEFELISQYVIKNIMFSNYFNIGSSTWASNSVIFQGSQNGSDWTTLLELTNLQNDSAQQTHSIENGITYLFYRFICQSSSTFYTGLGKIQFN